MATRAMDGVLNIPCNVFKATICICLGSFSVGYSLGYTSPVLPELEWKSLMPVSSLARFPSAVDVGAIIGSVCSVWLVDTIGRKKTVMLSTVPFVVGWTSIATAKDVYGFFIGRILTGCGCGIISVAVPVYIVEISSKENRGTLGAMHQLGIAIGILAVYITGSCNNILLNYQQIAAIGIVLPLVSNHLTHYLPESPKFLLYIKNDIDATESSLDWFEGCRHNMSNRSLDSEKSDTDVEGLPGNTNLDFWPRLRFCLGLTVFQQTSAIQAILFTAVNLHGAGLVTSAGGHLPSIIFAVGYVLASCFACYLIKFCSKRKVLVISGIGMAISTMLYSVLSELTVEGYITTFLPPHVSLFGFVIFYAVGWGAVPVITAAESFPTSLRASVCSMIMVVNWTCSFAVTHVFEYLSDLVGKSVVFSLISWLCALNVVFVLCCVSDRKPSPLSQLEARRTSHHLRTLSLTPKFA